MSFLITLNEIVKLFMVYILIADELLCSYLAVSYAMNVVVLFLSTYALR